MHLVAAHVRKYKAVADSDRIEIERTVTCLVGKNESGKTAILEALYRLNPLPSGHRQKFEDLFDYPRRHRSADKAAIPNTVPIEAEFELDDDDVKAVEEALAPGALAGRRAFVSKSYTNRRQWAVQIDEQAIVSHLASGVIPAGQLKGATSLQLLGERLESLEERTPSQDALVEKLGRLDVNAVVEEALDPRLPKFIYFDDYNILPGRFSIPFIQQQKENSLGAGERTALSLLRLAGVDSKEFLEAQYEARKAALEAAAGQITDEVFEYWSQNKNLRVDFDADFKAPAQNDRQPPFLEVRIWNDRHRVSLNFDERSTGFVWFFSFLTYFSEFRSTSDSLILLLDEPGLGLHAAAQYDLLRFIDEQLATHHQVLYTTHSPFMIDATQLQRVRTVEDRDAEGTKVSGDFLAAGRDTTFPLQAALGYELSQTLFVGPDNLIVEGPSDILYLQVVSEALKATGRTGLDDRWVLVPAGGVDKIPAFVSLFGTQLNLAVLLDVSSRGNQRIDELIKRGMLSAKRVFPVTLFTGGSEADIEDLFDEAFYLKLLKESGIASIKANQLPPGPRIIWRVEKHTAKSYDHYKPAVHLLKNQTKLVADLDEATLARFERLFAEVNATLT